MSASVIPSWIARRRAVWILFCGAAILVATAVAASQHETGSDRGGATSYTPTRGEWLCLVLNSRGEGTTSDEQLHLCAARAEQHAAEVAKVYGWQDWLKIEHRERKVTDMFASDELIRP
jgi:hypothetical protein